MTAVEDIAAKQAEIMAVLEANDAKLDEIRTYITALLGGGGATPEQLQVILEGMHAMKEKAASVLAETDALDETTTA